MHKYKFIIDSPSCLKECEEVSKFPDDVCNRIDYVDRCIYKKRFSEGEELNSELCIKYYDNVAYVSTDKKLSYGSTIMLI